MDSGCPEADLNVSPSHIGNTPNPSSVTYLFPYSSHFSLLRVAVMIYMTCEVILPSAAHGGPLCFLFPCYELRLLCWCWRSELGKEKPLEEGFYWAWVAAQLDGTEVCLLDAGKVNTAACLSRQKLMCEGSVHIPHLKEGPCYYVVLSTKQRASVGAPQEVLLVWLGCE